MGRVAAAGVWLTVIGEGPQIAFVAPPRRWGSQMERLALHRCQAARHGAPDGVDQVLSRLEYGPQPRRVPEIEVIGIGNKLDQGLENGKAAKAGIEDADDRGGSGQARRVSIV